MVREGSITLVLCQKLETRRKQCSLYMEGSRPEAPILQLLTF